MMTVSAPSDQMMSLFTRIMEKEVPNELTAINARKPQTYTSEQFVDAPVGNPKTKSGESIPYWTTSYGEELGMELCDDGAFISTGPDDVSERDRFPPGIWIITRTRNHDDHAVAICIGEDDWCEIKWSSGTNTELGTLDPIFVQSVNALRGVPFERRDDQQTKIQKGIIPLQTLD